jgi:hypothetical protein
MALPSEVAQLIEESLDLDGRETSPPLSSAPTWPWSWRTSRPTRPTWLPPSPAWPSCASGWDSSNQPGSWPVRPSPWQEQAVLLGMQAQMALNARAGALQLYLELERCLKIDTNLVTNTLDITPPASSVQTLPLSSLPDFTVAWSGSDSGSGIAFYHIYASVDGSAFYLWQEAVTTTSATFAGSHGHTRHRRRAGHVHLAGRWARNGRPRRRPER